MSKELREIVDKKPEDRSEDENKTLQAHLEAYRAKTNETDMSFGLTHAAHIVVGENGIVPAFKVVVLPEDALVETKKEASA